MLGSDGRAVRVTVFIALALSVAGCASEKTPTSTKAVSGLQQTREEVAQGRKQVDQVMAAATTLQQTQGDLKKPFGRYVDQIKNTEDQAANIRMRAEDMQKRAQQYQDKWAKEMSEVQDPTLRATASERAARVRQRYAKISQLEQDARSAYQPFIADLKDLQTYLVNDMTPAAARAAAPMFDKIQSDGRKLGDRLDALLRELDDISASMSPTGGAS